MAKRFLFSLKDLYSIYVIFIISANHLIDCGSSTAYSGIKLNRYVTQAFPGIPQNIVKEKFGFTAKEKPTAEEEIVSDIVDELIEASFRQAESATDGML